MQYGGLSLVNTWLREESPGNTERHISYREAAGDRRVKVTENNRRDLTREDSGKGEKAG